MLKTYKVGLDLGNARDVSVQRSRAERRCEVTIYNMLGLLDFAMMLARDNSALSVDTMPITNSLLDRDIHW